MIIPRSLRIALTALDTNRCGKPLSSERATGKAGHSMAQQTAMQEPQGFLLGQRKEATGGCSPCQEQPFPGHLHSSPRTLCRGHISPFLWQRQLNPAMPHPLSPFMTTTLHYSQGQSYETKRRRAVKAYGL